jgi:GNAT superfamily N-acetyltransferase
MTLPQQISGPFGTLEISVAQAADLPEVLGLFDDAVAWLNARGDTGQWRTTPFSASPRSQPRFMGWIDAGALFVARQAGRVVGTVALAEQPPTYAAHFWPAFPATAYYLEAFTTARDRAGEEIGSALLAWAEDYARQQGKETIWLDCWADSPGLVAYYRRAGYTPVDTFHVGEWRGQLFERALAPNETNSSAV